MANQALFQSNQSRQPLLAQRREVATDAVEGLSPRNRAETAGDLLLALDHAQIALGQAVLEVLKLSSSSIITVISCIVIDGVGDCQSSLKVYLATEVHTGPGLLPILGHDLPHVTDIRRMVAGEPVEGQRVVVVEETDSHGVLSAIEKLATAGKGVEIVTKDFYAGRDLVATHDLVLWKQRVLPHNIRITPHTTVVRIEPGQVIVVDRCAEGERVLPADAVVLGTKEFPRV